MTNQQKNKFSMISLIDDLSSKHNRNISIAILSSYVVLILQLLILHYFKLLGSPAGNLIQMASKVIVGGFFALSLSTVLKRHLVLTSFVYSFAALVFISNSILFPNNRSYMYNLVFSFFFTCLPSFIFAYSLTDKNVFKKMMFVVSDIVFAVGMIVSIFVFSRLMRIGTYNMALSYYLLLPAVIYYFKLITTDKKIVTLIKLVLSLVAIFSLGARGPILCFGVYVLLATVRNIKKPNYARLLLYSSVVFTMIIVFLFINNIIQTIYNILNTIGIQSRSLRLFLRDGIHMSGRDIIYDTLIDNIIKNPYIGIGIGGDRLVLGAYAHNVFLELASSFGIVIAGLLSVLILFVSYRTLFNKDLEISNLCIIWFSIGLVPLMISSSVYINFNTWIYFGIVLNVLRDSKSVINPQYPERDEIRDLVTRKHDMV